MSKDLTRSIRLDGDVAHIAQKLADDKMLSHTISKLLRQHYGLHTEIDAIKTRLNQTINERMLLQDEERHLADRIDELEAEMDHKKTNELPILRQKLDGALKTHQKIHLKYQSTHPNNRSQLRKQLDNMNEVIDRLSEQIGRLE